MKWKLPEHGSERVKKGFAWLPVRVKTTMYWLQRYELKERFYAKKGSGFVGWISENSDLFQYAVKENK